MNRSFSMVLMMMMLATDPYNAIDVIAAEATGHEIDKDFDISEAKQENCSLTRISTDDYYKRIGDHKPKQDGPGCI